VPNPAEYVILRDKLAIEVFQCLLTITVIMRGAFYFALKRVDLFD